VPRHVGRKYVAAALAAQDRLLADSSTDADVALGSAAAPAHLGPNGTNSEVIEERKR